ncbi:MAG: hypothetical protein OEO84_14420 [Betaproteobacteria bacterium]|nr:hypothetical protein [Betaproteobacteria bacterium]
MTITKLVFAALALCACTQAPAAGRLAEVNVYDRSDGRSLPVYWHQGRAYVVGKPGNEYRIAVRNRQGADLLAVMSVDGVNVITGETAHPMQSGYMLGPRGRLEVKGWRKSLARTAAFYFTELGDSYAARTGRPDNVGVIGVALFRRKAEPPQPFSGISPAPAERSAADAGKAAEAQAAAPLGTGHGRVETSYARHVAFERATATPEETVVIRYDSYRNLVALGVIREAPRSDPRPFPGFVPDA